MSGVALLADLAGRPLSPGGLRRAMAAIEHRGPHGSGRVELGWVGLGHLRFDSAPEGAGCGQPLADAGLRLAFEGRLDNRPELLAALDLEPVASDAEFVLAAYRRWGDGCFRRLLGPFAVAVVEEARRRVVLARDPLGECTLFFHHRGSRLVAASEEAAVLAAGDVPGELDEETLVRFLAVETPREGATFYAAVRELAPGHLLVAEAGDVRLSRFWSAEELVADPAPRRPDAEWIGQFRETLAASVAARLRAVGPIGVMLSGGLDSGSLACLAAEDLARRGEASRLRAFSWVFDELTACDERRWIDPLARRLDLDVTRVASDDAWPLTDREVPVASPGRADPNPYRPLKQRLYRTAAAHGVRVLLTGACGDLLYAGADREWLRAALGERRWALALGETRAYLRRGSRHRLVRGAAGLISPDRPVRRGLGRRRAWLRPGAIAHLDPAGPHARRRRLDGLAGPWSAVGVSAESRYGFRAGVELRDPFRDLRLVALAVQMPAHLLFRGGQQKWILRRALSGALAPEVRDRRERSDLYPLFVRGAHDRELPQVRELLARGGTWRRWVREDWMERSLARVPSGELSGPEASALWACVALECWLRREGSSKSPMVGVGGAGAASAA